jgi:hypothetical protein
VPAFLGSRESADNRAFASSQTALLDASADTQVATSLGNLVAIPLIARVAKGPYQRDNSVWCRMQESNPRPSVYKTAALPTELIRPTGAFASEDAEGPAFAARDFGGEAVRIERARLVAG